MCLLFVGKTTTQQLNGNFCIFEFCENEGRSKMTKSVITIFSLLIFFPLSTIYSQNVLFQLDDFEHGLGQWEFFEKTTMEPIADGASIVDSKDKEHGKVLSLFPGQLIALIKGSENWSNYVIEGDVYFPNNPASLLGLVYNFNLVQRPNWNRDENRLRVEFGSVYIKCGGSYIRVNPHYDGTAGRALYDDYKTLLTGKAAISINEWKHFKYEILEDTCHVYVDDMEKPKLTFYGYHHTSGRVGFRPRSSGTECWIDNVEVRAISKLSYKEQIDPENVFWEPGKLITDWDAIGPFKNRRTDIEEAVTFIDKPYSEMGNEYKWTSFPTDHRGCVISGKICDFNPPERRLAYFRTIIHSDKNFKTKLGFSSRSDLTVFVNGKDTGKINKVKHIWPDFWKVKRHTPTEIEISLTEGINSIVVLVDGGRYPGCGFYTYLEEIGI